MTDLRAQLHATLGAAYSIERELGGGGMRRVFLAQDRSLGRRVVVKVLPPDLVAGVSVDRFRREIELAAALRHPCIVPPITAGQAGHFLYYTMPFIAGESLRARLARSGELPLPAAVRLLRDVLGALAHAHRHGVVHRDLRPEHILLAEQHALVTDFGVAKALSTGTGPGPLTSARIALGTPAYMAPEQIASDPATDHRADVYAVGALAYELFTGHPPFPSGTPLAVLTAHTAEGPEPVAKRRPGVPHALAALVMRCLEKRAADRPQTAEEVLRELDALTSPAGGLAPTGAAPGKPARGTWWGRLLRKLRRTDPES